MARIKVIEESEATGTVKAAYDNMQRQMGFVPNVIKLFSLWPELLEANGRLFETVMLAKTELDNPTKEMIALVVSKANQCEYCATHHANFLVRYGVSEELARQLGEAFRKAAVDEKTKTLLAYAHKVTKHAHKVSDEDVEQLRQAGWTDRPILEATVVVAQFNFINRVVDALGAELEPVASAGHGGGA